MAIDYTSRAEKELRKFREDISKAKKKKLPRKDYQGIPKSLTEQMVPNNVPSSTLRSCDTSKYTMMSKRFKESPEVREQIEQKANSLAPICNKGAYTVIVDADMAKCAGRKL